jgi:hyperosmotically inducible periplasmic protein
MTRLTRSIAVLAATLMLPLTGCMSLHDPVVQFFNDSSITTEIKTRLAIDAPTSMATIGVNTSGDMVRLTGTVADEAERQRVEYIARDIAGANRVISELKVAGSPSAAPRAQK